MSRASLTALALAGLVLFEITHLVVHIPALGLAGAACFLVFLPFGNHRFRLRERYLFVVAVLSAVAAIMLLAEPWPLLADAARRGAYLAAFMLLLGVLRDGAMTSTSVLEVGRYLTHQPPGRRYWALAVGGHVMGVVMNFGALILLAPLVQRGAKDDAGSVPQAIVDIRERRQLSALARGFSWFIAWAPTSIAQVVAVAVVTGASTGTVALYGSGIAFFVVIAGWVEDWFSGRCARRRLGGTRAAVEQIALPRTGFVRLGMIYLALIVLSAGLAFATGTQLVNGIMLAAVPVTVLWIAMQKRAGRGDARSFSTRMRDLATRTLPDCSPEAATLALAGFTGTVLAGIVPPELIARVFGVFAGHPAAIYVALPAVIVLLSTVAMPPMLSVTFLGTAAARTAGLGLDPDLLALSLVLGWALNLTGSPFGATNLILARFTGIPVARLAYAWNGVFSLAAYAICAVALICLA